MREWRKSAFETALETAERMADAPLDARTVQWMRWAYLQAWLSPLGYRYEVRHGDATIGPVSWDQLIRGRTESKIPDGAEARIVGEWTNIADLLAGRSLDLADYESSRSFFEEANDSAQLGQRMVSALMRLSRVDDAFRHKIESDARARGWMVTTVGIDGLTGAIAALFEHAVPGASHRGTSFGEHQFHCLRRGALTVALRFETATTESTVIAYAYQTADAYVVVRSTPV